ncbi:retrovirus-related Pol polyprotein from transposon TNT 1-94 [Nephila pilipes]|uniref:Retrovirus-related Pol polyprotein from transposon TNT 1-94 n=1 Tax=Nephila pilipes TaxID=299642 RepID=A0A8X6NGU2_NEPPI|nr:retrovirus-related Pol polyprotein from transposon TNT 1-94 [Nephila pilipes]
MAQETWIINSIRQIVNKNLANGIQLDNCQYAYDCVHCIKNKLSEFPYPKEPKHRSKHPLDSVYIGLCEPMNTQSVSEIININKVSDDEQGNTPRIESIVLPRRFSRSNKGKPPDRLGYLANENKNDPENYKEALSRSEKNKLIETIEGEMRKSLYNNHTL